MSRPLGSRYRVGASVGSGSVGEVFLGEDEAGEIYAIKVLRPELARDPDTVARFVVSRNELLRLRGPHLTPVHDLVIEGDQLAIVMEMVPGGDLHHLLFRGPLPPREVARLGAGIANGLAEAHALGVTHGDVKPKNILIDYRENPSRPRLTDLGMCRIAPGGALALAGIAPYLAPEVWQGAAPDPASDLYALGIVLYEMCCGVPPFVGEPGAVRDMHLTAAPGRPDGIPDSLWGAILDLTARDPWRRPAGAASIAARLEGLTLLTASAEAAPALTVPPPPVHGTRPPPPVAAPESASDTTLVTPVVAPAAMSYEEAVAAVAAAESLPPTSGPPAPIPVAAGGWPPPARRKGRRGVIAAAAVLLLLGAGAVWAVAGGGDDATDLNTVSPPPPLPVVTDTPTPSLEPTPSVTPTDTATATATGTPSAIPLCAPVRLNPDGSLAATVRRSEAAGRCRVDVRMVQTALGVSPTDGYFGSRTEEAIRRHQSSRCSRYPAPGVIDRWTWDSVIRGRSPQCPSTSTPSPSPSASPSPSSTTTSAPSPTATSTTTGQPTPTPTPTSTTSQAAPDQ